MYRPQVNCPDLAFGSRPTRVQRTGSISVLSVFAILAASVCVALVVNSAWLTRSRQNNQQCAEAAAIAGCRSLLCDDMLRRNIQDFEVKGRTERCRDAALNIAMRYGSGNMRPLIHRDNIEVGYQANNRSGKDSVTLTDVQTPNYVAVRSGAGTSSGASSLMMANMTSIGMLSSSAIAVARLENNITGFKASDSVPIPIAPFAVPDSNEQIPECWSTEVESSDGQDSWAWLTDENRVDRDSDRIPEITLTLKNGLTESVPGCLMPINFADCSSENRRSRLDQLTSGLSRTDFPNPAYPVLQFPCSGSIDATARQSHCSEQFHDLVGQMRIFPVIQISQSPDDPSETDSAAVTFSRPVAARVMHVERGQTDVKVVLQPCVLSTSTALTSATTDNETHNPYIWKIRLAQ